MSITRRLVLTVIAHAMGLILLVVLGIPAVVNALAPLLRPRPRRMWLEVGALEQFQIGQVQEGFVESPAHDWARTLKVRLVYVWRVSGDEIVVFSRSCTDLMCPVKWDPGSECFFCPCHGGIFAKNGDRMAGPPNRPLYRYQTRVVNGVLEIDLYSLPPMT